MEERQMQGIPHGGKFLVSAAHMWPLQCLSGCHDRDIPPQPSHTYSCLLAVQTPPEHSLAKPKLIPGLPDPSIAFPNSSAAFLKGCCTNVCLVSIPKAMNTIPNEPKTSRIPSTNPELARSPLNPKTQYAQPRLGEA